MKPKDLYHQIAEIYNNFEFSTKLLIDNFLIISKDNYYLCYHKLDNGSTVQFRLEVNYLPSKIEDEDYVEYTMIYDHKTSQGDSPTIRIEGDKNIPEPIMNIIKPIIRQFKLKQLI
jgi:hypothetical protein